MSQQQFTQKSTEALQRAQELALEYGHQTMEQLHLLVALMEQEAGLIPQLLTRMGKQPDQLLQAAQAELDP